MSFIKRIFGRSKKECKRYITSSVYGKIYPPIYNTEYPFSNQLPDVYDKDGNKKDVFFIRDLHTAHCPYLNNSKYFLWDRYNFSLPVHFYSHNAMLETMGNPTHRYGMLIESRGIVPQDYEIFKLNRGLEQDFDAIFTYDDLILSKISNAKFYPFCGQVWFGTNGNGIEDELLYTKKSKNISIVSSNKQVCELHKIRIALARMCREKNLADAFGTFDGGPAVKISDTLTDYRYSICIENSVSDYFFTEKITNCFLSQTVPIYIGARKIDKFFNSDGMIILNLEDIDNIEKILKQCSRIDYEQRLPAIIDNYNRVQGYKNMDDYLYEHFFK